MKKEIHLWISITLVLFFLLISCIWWNNQKLNNLKQEQQITAYQAESQYQRSFGELSDSIQTMNGQLAQLLITTSQEQLLLGLSSLWREVYNAIHHLGSLPVAMQELESTDLLLNDVAEYSYYLLRKNVLQQQPLSSQDWNQLEDFYNRSKVVQTELENLSHRILSENLFLSTISLEDEKNVVATTFRSIESQVHAFPEVKFEEGVRKIEPEPRAITGAQISPTEAINIADNFLDTLNIIHQQGKIEFTSQDTKIPIYGIRYQNEQNHSILYVEVSQKGGQVLQFYQTREVESNQFNHAQALVQASTYLKRLNFINMVCIDTILDNNIIDFTFVPVQNGIYIYSDMIKIQIALDRNDLLKFDQISYATHHYNRQLASPSISKEQILKNMNPNFSIENILLTLIPDEYSVHELLAYEIRGTIMDETFSIFVNAATGQEMRIVRR